MATLFGPEMIADPYPVFHRLRSEDPVHWDKEQRVWILTRYEDVASALQDPRLSSARHEAIANLSSEDLKKMGLEELAPVFRTLSNMMVFSDPPKHTRLRKLVSKAFTPRIMEGMRSHIQETLDRVLDEVQAAGRMDVIKDLAYPLPSKIIAEMLGVPVGDRDRFKSWTQDTKLFFTTIWNTPEELQRALRSFGEFTRYLYDIVTQLREHPKDNLLSALVRAEEEGDKLSKEELFANTILIIGAGQETTTNLISNGIFALLRNPDQLQLLREDPSLIGQTVEELMRYDSPVQLVVRLAKEEFEIGGKKIKKGEFVTPVLAAANRDPQYFSNPDRLDITRKKNPHLAFGGGSHFCIGAPLGRLEGQIAILTLFQRFPNLQLTGQPLEYGDNFNLRALKALPVTW